MSSKEDNIEERALEELENIEMKGGLSFDKEDNTEVVKKDIKKTKSLGKATKSFTSAAGESPWKLVSLETLPSKGMMYPSDFEFLIKSAKTKEIRHWSTIDEHDPISVFEKINFVIESCSKLHIKGDPIVFNANDILEVDKYHIIFKIHKITFPNNENKLNANVKCKNKSCSKVTSIHTTDSNLKGFEYPRDLMEWYSEEERCFVAESEKLGETIRIYMPTIGSTKVFNEYKKICKSRGYEKDESFDKIAPYLISDWRKMSAQDLLSLRSQSNNWHQNKFLFLHKFTDQLSKNSKNSVLGICQGCKSKIDSSIFLGGSFTVKNIFIVSTRLRDLI